MSIVGHTRKLQNVASKNSVDSVLVVDSPCSSCLVGKIAIPIAISCGGIAYRPWGANGVVRSMGHVASQKQSVRHSLCSRDSKRGHLCRHVPRNCYFLHGRANLLFFKQTAINMAMPNPSIERDRLTAAPHVKR